MTSVDDTLDADDYDEFALLHENASEWDLPFDEPPRCRPRHVHAGGRSGPVLHPLG